MLCLPSFMRYNEFSVLIMYYLMAFIEVAEDDHFKHFNCMSSQAYRRLVMDSVALKWLLIFPEFIEMVILFWTLAF